MTYFYEILENDGFLTRLGWVESDKPIESVRQAAKVLCSFDASLAKTLAEDITLRRDTNANTPDYALWVCERKRKATLMVYQWPEAAYREHKQEFHKTLRFAD